MIEQGLSMNILLTNDDGIHAQGLWALHRVLSRYHDVTVVAPDRERSAVGHGITLRHPIRAAEVTVNGGRMLLDLAAFLDRGRTIVPLTFICDLFHVTADFDPETGSVKIATEK